MAVALIFRWWYFDDVRSKMGNRIFLLESLAEIATFLILMALLDLNYISLIRLFVIVSAMVSLSMAWVYLYRKKNQA